MARGLEVLQAALSGKRVRMGPRYGWLRWCPTCHTLEPSIEHGGHALPYGVTVHELWHENWEIEEPTLTFTEAVAAMDAGQTVTKGDGSTQFRWEDTDYWYRTDGDHEWFPDAVFGWEEVHATDWRIVTEESKDERPSLEEAERFVTEHLASSKARQFAMTRMLQRLAARWPAMFRKEDA